MLRSLAMISRFTWVFVAGVACKPAAPAQEPAPAEAEANVENEAEAAKATVEPEHPWPVAVLDVRGHAPLPDAPRQDVWLTMDGIGATVEGGEVHKLSVARAGVPEEVRNNLLLPVLYGKLSERTNKGTVTIWADEKLPVTTLVQAIYTAGKAGFPAYALVVGKQGAREVIAVQPPRYVGTTVELRGPAWGDLSLRWGSQGVHAGVFARYDDFPNSTGHEAPLDLGGGTCVFPGGVRPEHAPLRKALNELCTVADGKASAIRVSLDGIPTAGDLVWALAADARPPSCRLPAVVDAGDGRGPPSCAGAQPLAPLVAAFPPTAKRLSLVDAAMVDVGDDDDDVWDGLSDSDVGDAFGDIGLGPAGEIAADDTPLGVEAVVKRGTPKIKGPATRKEIEAVAKAALDPIRKCWEGGLRRNKKAKGRVEVQFTIGSTGRVPVVVVAKSSLRDREVGSCIVRAIKKHWRFPPRKNPGNAVVTLAFTLSAK